MTAQVSVLAPSLAKEDVLAGIVAGLPGDHMVVVPRGEAGRVGPAAAEIVPLGVLGSGRWAVYRGLARLLRSCGVTLVHLHADPASLLALRLTRFCASVLPQCAIVLEVEHASPLQHRGIWRSVASQTLRRTDAVIARHADGMGTIRSLGFAGVSVTSVAVGAALPLPSRAEARAVLGLPPEYGPCFVYAGAMTERAGLIDALEAVAACEPEIHLVVVGPAMHRQDVLAWAAALGAAERVVFRGAMVGGLSADLALLAVMDVLLVLPHPVEACRAPLDRQIVLAHACGVPVICTAVPGLPEVMGEGGWVVPPADPGLLFQLMRDLADSPSTLDRMCLAAVAQAESRGAAERAEPARNWAFQAARTARLKRLQAPIIQYRGVLKRHADL